jgi:NADPH:quinone reductase-like Zn-dependent oxidoreductase
LWLGAADPRRLNHRANSVIHATFPLEQPAEAHRLMESGAQIGKVVLIP